MGKRVLSSGLLPTAGARHLCSSSPSPPSFIFSDRRPRLPRIVRSTRPTFPGPPHAMEPALTLDALPPELLAEVAAKRGGGGAP